jgi:phosphodiesterase/alkaline phosphatase D-like protein
VLLAGTAALGAVVPSTSGLTAFPAAGVEGVGYAPVRVPFALGVAERFRPVVAAGVEVARSELAHSVHVEVSGLRPGAECFYRFRVGRGLSPAGRTKTARPHVRITSAVASRLMNIQLAVSASVVWHR